MYFYFQDRENYGSSTAPYWKNKGGEDIILDADSWTEEMAKEVIRRAEIFNPMFERHIIGFQPVSDTFMTDFEQSQKDYEGTIAYPATRMSYEDYVNIVE
jgi:hypothetical protein